MIGRRTWQGIKDLMFLTAAVPVSLALYAATRLAYTRADGSTVTSPVLDTLDADNGSWWLFERNLFGRVFPDMTGNRRHMYAGSTKVAAIIDGGVDIPPGVAAGNVPQAQAAAPAAGSATLVGNFKYLSTGNQEIISCFVASTNTGVGMRLNSSGNVVAMWGDGATGPTATASAATLGLTANDGSSVWIKIEFDSGVEIRFYTSPDGTDGSWTLKQTTASAVTVAVASSTVLYVGARNGQSAAGGRVYKTRAYQGLHSGGSATLLSSPDFTDKIDGRGAFIDAQNNHWQVGQNASSVIGGRFSISSAVSSSHPAIANPSNLKDITGNLTIEAKVSDWQTSGNAFVCSNWISGGVGGIGLRLDSDGGLALFNGTTGSAGTSTTIPSQIQSASPVWLRVTFRVSDLRVQFFWSSDYDPDSGFGTGTWTQIGTDRTFSAFVFGTSTDPQFRLGERSANNDKVRGGAIYRVRVFASIDGTDERLDVSAENLPDGARFWTDAQDRSWVMLLASGTPSSNDPTLLYHDGEDYIYLPGVNSNALSAPDEAAFATAGDREWELDLALDDWTPSSGTMMAQLSATTTAFRFDITGAGLMRLLLNDGVGGTTATSSIAVPAVDGQRIGIKATWRVSDGRVQFFTRGSATQSWVQLGTDQTIAIAGIADVTVDLTVGAERNGGTTAAHTGRFYRAIMRIAGTTVFDTGDFQGLSPAAASYVAPTGQTVTLNRSTTGRKLTVVDRTGLLFGTDKYLAANDDAALDVGATDPLTAFIATRSFATTQSRALIAKKTSDNSAATIGWILSLNTNGELAFRNADGTTQGSAGGAQVPTVGIDNVLAGRETGANSRRVSINGSFSGADTTVVGDLSNAEEMRIGRLSGSGTSYMDMFAVAAGVVKVSKSDTDIADLNDELWPVAGGLTAVGKDLDFRWSIQQLAADNIDLRWAVQQLVAKNLDTRWGVNQLATDNVDLQWGIRQVIGDDLDLRWGILEQVGANLGLEWSIRQVAGDDLALVWEVIGGVGKNLSLEWAIRQLSGDDLNLQWASREVVGKSGDLRWGVRQVTSNDLSLLWSLRQIAGDNLEILWGIGDITSGAALVAVGDRAAVVVTLSARTAVQVKLFDRAATEVSASTGPEA